MGNTGKTINSKMNRVLSNKAKQSKSILRDQGKRQKYILKSIGNTTYGDRTSCQVTIVEHKIKQDMSGNQIHRRIVK